METIRWHKPGSQTFRGTPWKMPEVHTAKIEECFFCPLVSKGCLLTVAPTTSCRHHRWQQELGPLRPRHRIL